MAPVCDENSVPVAANVMDLSHPLSKFDVSDQKAATPLRGKKRKAAHKLGGVRKAPLIECVEDTIFVDQVCDEAAIKVSFDSLEAYKTMIGPTEDLPAISGFDTKDNEWQDPNTGVKMAYAACGEDTEDETETLNMEAHHELCGHLTDGQSGAPFPQYTLEWQDAATETKMGYAICGEESEDEALMQIHGDELCGDVKDVQTYAQSLQCKFEWQDAATNTIMGYAISGEETEDEALVQMGAEAQTEICTDGLALQCTLEFQDVATNTMMGYMLCDEADEEFQAVKAMFADGERSADETDESSSDNDMHSTRQTRSGPSSGTDASSCSGDDATSSCEADVSSTDSWGCPL